MNAMIDKRPWLFSYSAYRVTSKVVRYGFACLAALLALLLTRWISPYIDSHLFDLFQGAVVLSAWYGGLGPGIVTASLSIMALDYFFMPPYFTFSVGVTDLIRLLVFGAVAFLTSSLSNQLRQAKSEIELAHEKLEERIEQRTLQLSTANTKLVDEIAQRMEAEKTILEVSHREQSRLGQDLHDGLCQTLAGVRLMSEDLKGKLSDRLLPEAEDAKIIEARLEEALTQADTISRGLYPVELETNGLMAALEEMAEKISRVSRIECRFVCQKSVEFPDASVANHLYRIAQEAVANAIKSGKAKRVKIHLSQRRGHGKLSIMDDGIGLGRMPLRKGMGLKLMQNRAQMIDAFLRFQSRGGGCTRVSCSWSAYGF